MTNVRILKITLLIFVLVVTTAALHGDDSRNHPVTAVYCDKSTISIYPYSFVTRDDQSTFKCYEVKASPITDGIRYHFEDSNDMDYNDVVIDVWTIQNDSGQPRLKVRLISTDAGYRHQIHIVYNNRDINLFDVSQTSPGTVFTHILPVRDCPEFTLDINPKSQIIGSGGQAVYRITAHLSNGFSSILRLKARDLPDGISAGFNPPVLLPHTESDLTLKTGQGIPAGKYFFTVEAAGGGFNKSVKGLLEVFKIDLKISKTVDKISAKPENILNYDILLKNDSSTNLDNLTIEDKLSEDLILLSQSSRFNFSREDNQLKWLGDLKQGKSLRIKIQARLKPGVTSPAEIINQAEARSDIIPEGIKSNQVITTVSSEPIHHSAIIFTKDVNRPQTELGRIVTFRLSVINRSGSILLNPGLIDYLPQGFSYIPGSSLIDFKKYTDPQGKNAVSWQLPNIGPGQHIILSFQTVIGTDTRRGKNVNRASFTCLDNSGQSIKLEAQKFINVSSTGFQFFSGVEGTVYLDRDYDSFFSMTDTPLSGIEVRLSTGEKTLTDTTGLYRFENLYAGEYAVGINSATLPQRYRQISKAPQVVVLSDGFTDTADFPIGFSGDDPVKTARLEGFVFYDKNQNLTYDSGDIAVETFKAIMSNRIYTGSDGKFIFTKLKPGPHTLRIQYGPKTLDKKVALNHGKNLVKIPLKYTGIKIIVSGEEK